MNLVILGPQGCGKGTQAEKLVEKYGLYHIDMGKALREAAKEETELGQKLNEVINVRKELVSDDLVVSVLRRELEKVPAEQGIIFDGAPRRIEQVDEVEGLFKEFGRIFDKVIHVNISEKESIFRISKRYNCTKCAKGLILGKDFQNIGEACHYCDSPIEQRLDDTPDGVRKRLKIFHEETLPVIEYYRKEGKLIEVNGEQNPEKVLEEIIASL